MVKLTAQNELNGYIYLCTLEGHHYFLSECKASWEEANEAAIEMGGYLATISNYFENSNLGSLVNPRTWYPDELFFGAWIGFRGEQGVFEWANGEPISYVLWGPYYSSEPVYADGGALLGNYDEVQYDEYDFGWMSAPITFEAKYIVEFPFELNCNFSNKTYVCHNGNTICVNVSALQSHLDHGDFEGPCGPCNTNAMQILPDNEAVMEGHEQQTEMEMITTPQEGITIAHDRNQLYVYPNPASAEIHVALPEVHKEGTLRILSLDGQEMHSLLLTGEQAIALDLSAYASGLYIVKVQLASGPYQKKIVKL